MKNDSLAVSFTHFSDEEKELFDNRISVRLLSTKEAADYLRISPNALRILVHREKIRAYKLGSLLRFRIEDISDLLKLKEI